MKHNALGKLLIGLDQFEEIVDDLAGDKYVKQWKPLVDFIEYSCNTNTIGFVFTLESSRRKEFQQCDLPKTFTGCEQLSVDGANNDFLLKIIEIPFKKAGYFLSTDVVQTLMDNVNGLKLNMPANESSLLPLVALKLAQLFDKIVDLKGIPDQQNLQKQFGGISHSDNEITLEDVGNDLDICSSISEIAGAAWLKATGQEIVKEEDIDHFLQPLIRMASPYSNNLVLGTMGLPPYIVERKIAESFKQHRLLILENERFRLVHEAVIRHWEPASQWLERRSKFLKTEAFFRTRAEEWQANNQPNLKTSEFSEDLEKNIGHATEILNNYLRSWSFSEPELLTESDQYLQRYCLALFNQSKTPSHLVPQLTSKKYHVHLASQYGQLDLLKKFSVIDSTCLEHLDSSGRPPITCAAWSQIEIVKFLIENGVQVAKASEEGFRSIASSIQMGRRDIFDLLLPHYKDSELDNPQGGTLLHLCALAGQKEMAQHLIEARSLRPEVANKHGWLPLHNAAFFGKVEIFTYLCDLSDFTAINEHGWTALHLAAQEGHVEIIKILLEKISELPQYEFNVRTKGDWTALMIAASHHHSEVVELLLSVSEPNLTNNADNLPGSTALHLAIALAIAEQDSTVNNQNEILKTIQVLLEDPRTDPNIKNKAGDTPLALATDMPKVFRAILCHSKLDLNNAVSKSGENPLMISAKTTDWQLFSQLLSRADLPQLTTSDNKENNLLHLMAMRGAPENLLQKILDTAEISVNQLNIEGFTPLMNAIDNREWGITRFLLSSDRVDPNIYGKNTPSVLALALNKNAKTSIVDEIWDKVDQGVALTQADKKGWTALHVAALSNNRKTIDWILTLGQDKAINLFDIVDNPGRKPADLAPPSIRGTFTEEKVEELASPRSWDSDLTWKKLPKSRRVRFFEHMESKKSEFNVSEKTPIEWCNLSFYDKDVRLIRMIDPEWPDSLELYYLEENKDKFVQLNGTSSPIHDINSRHVNITKTNALGYLRFFCFFVRGKGGPFVVIESLAQREIPQDLTEEDKKEVDIFARSAELHDYNKDEKLYPASAVVWYANALFLSDFKILSSGMVVMTDDFPLYELSKDMDMPIS